jgi:hypothetical protein
MPSERSSSCIFTPALTSLPGDSFPADTPAHPRGRRRPTLAERIKSWRHHCPQLASRWMTVAASPGEQPVLEVVRVYTAVIYVAGRLSSVLARHDGKPCNARRGSRGHHQRSPCCLQASSQPALSRSGCGWENATCLQPGSPPRVTCPPGHPGSSTCPRCQSLSLLCAKTLVSYDDQQQL